MKDVNEDGMGHGVPSATTKSIENSSIPPEELAKYHVEDLTVVAHEDLARLWPTLSAPKVPEDMDGEYEGYIFYGGDLSVRAAQMATTFNLGEGKDFWRGKAIKTTSPNKGIGYNRFMSAAGAYKRAAPYKWEIGPSAIDGQPALIIFYDHVPGGPNLVDEVRMLNERTFLCTVYADQPVPGIVPRQRGDGSGRSENEFFALAGPISAYHGLDG